METAICTKQLCPARLGALVASSAHGPLARSEVHAAMGAGATSTDVLNTLAANLPVVGQPRIVAAAPRIALALGYDLDLLGSEG